MPLKAPSSSFSVMSRKGKASNAGTENLQTARETFSGKHDEIVCFKSFINKTHPKPLHNVPDG